MGTVELNNYKRELTIYSWIISYGNAATLDLSNQMKEEIEALWNDPKGIVRIENENWQVRFRIEAYLRPTITQEDILSNVNPKNNYFRIEEFAEGNISFVDGLGSNSGYFLLENLYAGSTTAAHEYGHTLGLAHPVDLDFRGRGAPGIMYPRGTLVDSPFQYDPSKPAGVPGGTMHPKHRKVRQEDIALLQLHRLNYQNNSSILGTFSSVWHAAQIKPSN